MTKNQKGILLIRPVLRAITIESRLHLVLAGVVLFVVYSMVNLVEQPDEEVISVDRLIDAIAACQTVLF